MFNPATDSLYSRIRNVERDRASDWSEMIRRYESCSDKTYAITLIVQEFDGKTYEDGSKLRVSRSTFFRKRDEIAKSGIRAIITKGGYRRAVGAAAVSTLPRLFVNHWRELCAAHQRMKTLSAWRQLMRNLRTGLTVPGYGTDWRGIWASEHPGEIVPAECPYTECWQGALACAPRGWSYSNLLGLAPDDDIMLGASVGVMAMRDATPPIPHTRENLRPMMMITMDDVKLDVMCWFGGEDKPRCPVGLGVEDVATANMVDFALVPVRRRDDGTLAKLDGTYARYVWANILCGIGIDNRDGLTALLEHGTAGLSREDEKRLNDILGEMPDGRKWVRVVRSSTSGAPILKGLFAERGRGRPTHKAMIEATWNRLHNELAMLPGQSGKDWEHAPQDAEGWSREDRALIKACTDILETATPQQVEILKRAQTFAQPYGDLYNALRAVINALNTRRDHGLQNWVECGFVKSMVEVAGHLLPLDRAAADMAGGDEALKETMLKALAPRQKMVRMSPAEAWHSFGNATLKRFPPFVATRILGPELAQSVTVERGRFMARNHFTGLKMQYGAMANAEDGTTVVLANGERLQVWVNPMCADAALVADADGKFIGTAPLMAATPFGHTDADAQNLGILSVLRGEQRRRAEAVLGGRREREAARRAGNAQAVAEALAAPSAAAQSQFDELAGEGSVELGDL